MGIANHPDGAPYSRLLALGATPNPRIRLGVDQVATPVPAKSRSEVQISASTLQASASTWASLTDPLRLGTASFESHLASFEKGHQRGDGDDRHFRDQSIDDFEKLRLFQPECDARARFMDRPGPL